jgi:hypothetical protein
MAFSCFGPCPAAWVTPESVLTDAFGYRWNSPADSPRLKTTHKFMAKGNNSHRKEAKKPKKEKPKPAPGGRSS